MRDESAKQRLAEEKKSSLIIVRETCFNLEKKIIRHRSAQQPQKILPTEAKVSLNLKAQSELKYVIEKIVKPFRILLRV